MMNDMSNTNNDKMHNKEICNECRKNPILHLYS